MTPAFSKIVAAPGPRPRPSLFEPTEKAIKEAMAVTIEEAVQSLISSMGELTPEQRVLAGLALRLARGLGEDVAAYALAAAARELRATVAALVGAPVAGQGVPDREWDEWVARLSEPTRWEEP